MYLVFYIFFFFIYCVLYIVLCHSVIFTLCNYGLIVCLYRKLYKEWATYVILGDILKKQSKSLMRLKIRWKRAKLLKLEGIYIKDINMNTKDVKSFLKLKDNEIIEMDDERMYITK